MVTKNKFKIGDLIVFRRKESSRGGKQVGVVLYKGKGTFTIGGEGYLCYFFEMDKRIIIHENNLTKL